jgi:uncharacterized membrane protein YqhA
MFEHLLKVRYLAAVIVIVALLHAVAFLVLGTRSAIKTYGQMLDKATDEPARPGLQLLHSLDFLFVSMVLLVIALGIAKLFLLDPTAESAALPGWLRIASISDLKVLLWETILTSLLIIALSDLAASIFGRPDWTVLVTPTAILILALSLYFMKKS